jgi:iron complex transport system substrate-binding protein
MYKHILKIALVLLLFVCCQPKKAADKNKIKTQQALKYATGFTLEKNSNFTLLTVKNSFPEDHNEYKYILYKKGVVIPDSLKNYTAIEVPIKTIAVTSTTHIPSLEMLNETESLVAFAGLNYISSKKTRSRIDAGKVKELGNNNGLNTEILFELQPDVLVGFTVDSDYKTKDNLVANGQKVIMNADWTETSPLGKAEWIKFFGALYDKNELADSLFNKIENDYLETKERAKTALRKPTVMAGAMYQDQWFLPNGNSWAAQLIADANSEYLWAKTSGTGSLSLSFESVLVTAQNANYWIGPAQYTSLAQMKADSENYTLFEAYKKQNVFSFSTKKGATGGVIYYELAPNRPDLVLKDIVKMLHPTLLPHHSFEFFERLE